MKLKQLAVGILMVACAGLAIFGLVKFHKAGGDGGDADDAPPENVVPVVTVHTNVLKRMTFHGYVSGYGVVEPAPAIADQPAAGGPLFSPSAGVAAKVSVIQGQQVKAGDVLIELNSGTATFGYAQAQLERQKQLFAQQNTSLKNLQDAESQLAALTVVAPISGTVTRISAKVGGAVDVNTPVAEVVDLNRLSVVASISAADANQLKTNQEVQITVDPPVNASLAFVSPVVDTNDGTVSVTALLPPDSGLRPGQFVPLKIVTAVHSDRLAAPIESVVTDEEGKSVISLVKGENAAQLPVKAGLRENGWVEIEGADLKEGDAVVAVGAYGLPDKVKIRYENAGEKSSNSTAEP